MNITPKIPQKSSIFSKNPYNATGLTDSNTTSPLEASISRIKANFGRNCQNILYFAARASLGAAQKTVIGGAL